MVSSVQFIHVMQIRFWLSPPLDVEFFETKILAI